MTNQENMDKINIDDIYGIIQELLFRENKIGPAETQYTWIVSLSKSNTLLSIEEVSSEVNQDSKLLPQHVFRIALMKEANKIILVHYHASEELKPSENEKNLTQQMIQAGNIINVQVLDHLIVNEKEFFSFKKHGLM